MLVLDRNLGQTLMIGDHIRIEVIQVNGKQVRLGITAPQYIGVFREEIYKRILRERRSMPYHDRPFSMSRAAPPEPPGLYEATGIPVYQRIRYPWTKQD